MDIVNELRGFFDPTEGLSGREARAQDLMLMAAAEIERLRKIETKIRSTQNR